MKTKLHKVNKLNTAVKGKWTWKRINGNSLKWSGRRKDKRKLSSSPQCKNTITEEARKIPKQLITEKSLKSHEISKPIKLSSIINHKQNKSKGLNGKLNFKHGHW